MIKQYVTIAAMPFSTSACFVANGSHLPSLMDTEMINWESEVLGGLHSTPGKPIANAPQLLDYKTQLFCLKSGYIKYNLCSSVHQRIRQSEMSPKLYPFWTPSPSFSCFSYNFTCFFCEFFLSKLLTLDSLPNYLYL